MYTSIRYTFETYNNPWETRGWLERFLLEHDREAARVFGFRKPTKQRIAQVISSKMTNGVAYEYVRIKYDGELIGYASGFTMPNVGYGMTIQNVYILPRYRNLGHYHAMFPNLVRFCDAHAVTLGVHTYEKHKGWYASIGFRNCLTLSHESPYLVRVTTDERKAAADKFWAEQKEAA